MQTPIYQAKDEQALMSHIWAPQIKNDPLAFVMFQYPWGKQGTPLEHHSGPRRWQKKVLRQVAAHIAQNGEKTSMFDVLRMAVASGRGIGKSALVSWLVHWFLSTRIGSTTIVSANSENQLRGVTWAEITKWLSMALNSHWFEVSATRVIPAKWLTELVERDLRLGTRYWGIEGKLWSEENPDAYAGVHNFAGVLLIFDESSGIPDSIWSVAAGFFTEDTANRFWFAFSNPRRNSGYFYECFNSKRDFWLTDNIDARTVEGTDSKFYDAIIEEYGPDSYQANVEVYGEFPDAGDELFISPSIVRDAMERDVPLDPTAPIAIGVDPARFGSDSTVIAIRQGRKLLELRRHRGEDTMEVVGRVIDAIEEFKPALVCIDEGGLGAGVVDRLKEQRYKVRGVNFANKSRNRKMYVNKRAEIWGETREWLKTADVPSDKFLKADLTAPTVKYDSMGAMQLESKQDMKKRGLSSPDAADALALTFAFPLGHRETKSGLHGNRKNSYYVNNSISTSWLGA